MRYETKYPKKVLKNMLCVKANYEYLAGSGSGRWTEINFLILFPCEEEALWAISQLSFQDAEL